MSTEAWVEADQLLAQVAPAVAGCCSVDEKSPVPSEITYSLLRDRFGSRPLPRARTRRQGQQRQHNRALKRVTVLKNEARQAPRQAQRNESEDEIWSCCSEFLSLLCEHSRLKRASDRKGQDLEASAARKQCHQNFWLFTKYLLDSSSVSNTSALFPTYQLRISSLHCFYPNLANFLSHPGCPHLLIQSMRCPVSIPSPQMSC